MSTAPAHVPLNFRLPQQPLLGPLARQLLAWPAIAALYRQSLARGERGRFVENALATMGLTAQVSPDELRNIPSSGALIIVANHPFGGIDGLALLAIARRVRPDVKLLANHFLRVFPELGETSLFVDPFGGAGATARNLRAMRQALRWVGGGGALVVFPAGKVSHLHLRRRAVQDGPWHAGVARLASRARAAVVPIFIEGRNSGLFQCAGLVHPILRTLLLPREMLRMRNHSIVARVGSAISPERFARFGSDRERIDYLRVRTEILRARAGAARITKSLPRQPLEPIIARVDAQQIGDEVRNLPPDRRVGVSGDFAVYFARADEIPSTLREIGRLREITFRAVGEGTGREIDLDRFDANYLHLFVWNRCRREIVGAYRLGLTDQILATRGREGLYTSTLFRFRQPLLDQISPAIELGRSFVRGEYQREFAPLLLLWKGIGQFVARHPKYRRLFGPVSISSEYSSLTRQLLISFLTITSSVPALAKLVSPRNPPPRRLGPGRRWESSLVGTVVRSIDDVDVLVAEIESDRRGVPVLLRQYLKLGAKLLGFNVDPDFGDVLDGLMLVDLFDVQPAVLDRYMGRDAAARFRAIHSTTSVNPQSDSVPGPHVPIMPADVAHQMT